MENRRNEKSLLLSLLLLAGLGVGAAGIFSQHYRIEFAPKRADHVASGKTTAGPSQGESADTLVDEPAVILVDGCESEDAPLYARNSARLMPAQMRKGRASGAKVQPCDESDSLADVVKLGGAATAIAPQLMAANSMVDVLTVADPMEPLPINVDNSGGASNESPSGYYEAGAALLTVLSPVGERIFSLPAQETSAAPTVSSLPDQTAATAETEGAPTIGATANVPEPDSLDLLFAALLGLGLGLLRRARVAMQF